MKNIVEIFLSIMTTVYLVVLVRNLIKYYTEFDMFPDSISGTVIVLGFLLLLVKAADVLLTHPINKEHPNGN